MKTARWGEESPGGWLLDWISNVLPLSYAVDATNTVTRSAELTGTLTRDLLVVAGAAALALALGAATLRRQTH